jgi:hypothetical protein
MRLSPCAGERWAEIGIVADVHEPLNMFAQTGFHGSLRSHGWWRQLRSVCAAIRPCVPILDGLSRHRMERAWLLLPILFGTGVLTIR